MSQLWKEENVREEYLTMELSGRLHPLGPQICIIMVIVGATSQGSSSSEKTVQDLLQ